MFYDPRSEPHGLPHNPWMALVVPRPIAWISTVDADGVPNLSPYSAFNTVSTHPPFVMFSSYGVKDSLTNAQTTGEFCVNIVTYALRDKMNTTCAPFPPDVNEFTEAGVTPVPCQNIGAPRVAESPISIECRLSEVVDLKPASGLPCDNHVVIGEVVGIHIDDDVLIKGQVDLGRLQPLARLGYREYCVASDAFEMIRPTLSVE